MVKKEHGERMELEVGTELIDYDLQMLPVTKIKKKYPLINISFLLTSYCSKIIIKIFLKYDIGTIIIKFNNIIKQQHCPIE